jgi:MoxR-like ATPase
MNNVDIGRLGTVVSGNVPPMGEHWDFADDSQWIETIENLSLGEVREFCGAGYHRAALQRVRNAMKDVQNRFQCRDHAVEMMVACAMAQTNMVYLGPPGVAKSLIVRTFARCLGVRPHDMPIASEPEIMREMKEKVRRGEGSQGHRPMFEYLLTRYTQPEELFGGTDLDLLLSAGVFGRRTRGMLPQAEIAFLDEIFKANSAILNALLSVMNERVFYNMGQAFRVNMAFAVAASNETPDESELGALFDRFPMRVPCLPVPEAMLDSVIEKAHAFDTNKMFHRPSGAAKATEVPRLACLNDLRLLTKVIQGGAYGGAEPFGQGGAGFKQDFMDMLRAVRRDFGVSDRTPVQVLRVCRALGILDGVSDLAAKQLRAWGYVAGKLEELDDLQRFVRSKILSLDEQAGDLFDVC